MSAVAASSNRWHNEQHDRLCRATNMHIRMQVWHKCMHAEQQVYEVSGKWRGRATLDVTRHFSEKV